MHHTARSCLTALLAAATVLSGCFGPEEPEVAVIETVSGFAGIAVADEPRAALVGRQILGQNGNAIDAAVAMAFTMTVTLPSRAGLAGGGACVVHKRESKATEALLFLPGRGEDGAIVPGLSRGMAALHARYGLQAWGQLVSPAERLARFGFQISRAFRADLVQGRDRLDEAARAAYLRADGSLPAVGDRLSHPALSAVLAGLRGKGAGYMYTGNFARRLAEAMRSAGEPLTVADLRAYRAEYVAPLAVPFGDHQLYLPPPPVLGGLTAGQVMAAAPRIPDAGNPASPRRAHVLVEAWKRALSERQAWLNLPAGQRPDARSLVSKDRIAAQLADRGDRRATPAAQLQPAPQAVGEDAPTAGLAAADRFGNLVACTLTMNGLFGTGEEADGTGILLAGRRMPAESGAGMVPVVAANPYTGTGYLAASAAGGTAGQSALAQTLLPLESIGETYDRNRLPTGKLTLPQEEAPEDADKVRLIDLLALARLHHPGQPDVVRYETGVADAVRRELEARGHRLTHAESLGRVGAIYCPEGPRNAPAACQQATDPRGHGLAVRAE